MNILENSTPFCTSTEPVNEPVKEYGANSDERVALRKALSTLGNHRAELTSIIGGERIKTDRIEQAIVPHNHAKALAIAHLASRGEVDLAIASAKTAWWDWSRTPWSKRAAIFLKAADLVSGPWRARLNAATMLGQSKTVYQAEIDAAAEFVDFLRFNVAFAERIYREQPISLGGVRNMVDYRPLEGFVYAITPFNFTAIAGNLPTAPAILGNTVVWKPSPAAKLSAYLIMEILEQAGLPSGVINLVFGDAEEISEACFSDPNLAGVHFTGSTSVFAAIQSRISNGRYRNHPRIVGETGGKNFILAHETADVAALSTAIIRAGFEYQGQKCSAASRIFVPRSMWRDLRERLIAEISTIKVGDVGDFTTFMGAVIHENSWRRLSRVLDEARADPNSRVEIGGTANASFGYFVSPTLLHVDDPASRFMRDEFFGPIVSAYVYEEGALEELLKTIDTTTDYGLTGAVFAQDEAFVRKACQELRFTAGNFYINDKPTGAVVGQQPFGGARSSGTNDKAGSLWNLTRWLSPRTIKETSNPPHDYRYPSMTPE